MVCETVNVQLQGQRVKWAESIAEHVKQTLQTGHDSEQLQCSIPNK